MAWPHCERRNGMSPRVSFERQWNGLTVSTAMAWPHEYLLPIPQSIVFPTPTYLLPDSFDRRPKVYVCLGGGVGFGTMSPLRTSTVIPVSYARVNTLYDT